MWGIVITPTHHPLAHVGNRGHSYGPVPPICISLHCLPLHIAYHSMTIASKCHGTSIRPYPHIASTTDMYIHSQKVSVNGDRMYCTIIEAETASRLQPASSAISTMLFAVGVHVTIIDTRKKVRLVLAATSPHALMANPVPSPIEGITASLATAMHKARRQEIAARRFWRCATPFASVDPSNSMLTGTAAAASLSIPSKSHSNGASSSRSFISTNNLCSPGMTATAAPHSAPSAGGGRMDQRLRHSSRGSLPAWRLQMSNGEASGATTSASRCSLRLLSASVSIHVWSPGGRRSGSGSGPSVTCSTNSGLTSTLRNRKRPTDHCNIGYRMRYTARYASGLLEPRSVNGENCRLIVCRRLTGKPVLFPKVTAAMAALKLLGAAPPTRAVIMPTTSPVPTYQSGSTNKGQPCSILEARLPHGRLLRSC
mmetsp:Transcript_65961/g.130825  ORF Transcript_65961/g.130825 Transcript_65961/m.130825 type:complete len:426 (+) Transcript_65961:166-1443(+)